MSDQATKQTVTFRRNAAGKWAVYGPAEMVKDWATIQVAKKDGTIVDVEIGSTMIVGEMAWGTINSQRPAFKQAKAPASSGCRHCHCTPVWKDGLCRMCHHDEYDTGN